MKNLTTLKQLLKVFSFTLWALFYLSIILFISLIFYGDRLENAVITNPMDYNFDAWGVRLYFAAMLGLYYMFAKAVSLLYKATISITATSPFPSKPLLYKTAGNLFILAGIGVILLQFIGPLLFINELHLRIDYTTLNAVFLIIIGLFFMFFGEAFLQAIAHKKENDLTI